MRVKKSGIGAATPREVPGGFSPDFSRGRATSEPKGDRPSPTQNDQKWAGARPKNKKEHILKEQDYALYFCGLLAFIMSYIWGIDLGGTKIEGIVINAITDEVLIRKRLDTEAVLGYTHILKRISILINDLKNETGLVPEAIGFSTPGTLDPTLRTMKNCNTVCMNGQPMKKDLENRLGVRIEMANDANCFALAEANKGAGKGKVAEVIFGVIMGSGVGGGLVVNGKVIGGRHGIGGEWGHNQLDINGPDCYCGKVGCNEVMFSGPALEKRYEKATGTFKKLKEIVEAHLNGYDKAATEVVEFLLESFAKAISVIINVCDPELIILGGGVGNVDLLYTEGVKRVEKYIFNNKKVETQFLKPLLGDSAGVFGAAELVRK